MIFFSKYSQLNKAFNSNLFCPICNIPNLFGLFISDVIIA